MADNIRSLILVMGDQLDEQAPVLADLDPSRDMVWMAEVREEAEHVWCHKTRLVLFFSAMRHFRDHLLSRGFAVRYHELSAEPGRDEGSSLGQILGKDIQQLRPLKIVLTHPGDFRVLASLQAVARENKISLEIMEDRHFLCSCQEFESFASGRKRLVQEDFYRFMRRRTGLLMDDNSKPAGGRWNFDRENRAPLPRRGLKNIPVPRSFTPGEVTRKVMSMVESRFASHPGSCRNFDLPVTRNQAKLLLRDFISNRLREFGTCQDVMQTGEPLIFHSRLSASMNLKLLSPGECLEAALEALEDKTAPMNSVEGFVRQILGWREYVRGVYWQRMPGYQELNFLDHQLPVPSFFWDGNTDMACLRDSMASVLDFAYSHHIQRLMVLGLFALLSGVHPLRFHEWHMAMYADAIDWVSLPNTLGMSQYADGGIVGSKPYCASGKYIQRMSDYCRACSFDPAESAGPGACPFTTLYWDFLDRHLRRLENNPRMFMQLANLKRRSQDSPLMRKNRLAAMDVLKRYFK